MEEHKALPTTDEIYKMVKENNHMLKAIRRDAFVGGIFKFIFWIVIFIIIPYITYVVYVKPLVDRVIPAAQELQQNVESVNATVNNFPDLGKLLEQFTGNKAAE